MHTRNGRENLQEVDVNHTLSLFGKFSKFFDSVQIGLKKEEGREELPTRYTLHCLVVANHTEPHHMEIDTPSELWTKSIIHYSR
jgi:hypothetical protein